MLQELVSRDKEPITPFISKIRALAGRGVSCVLVIGGSGEYFDVAGEWQARLTLARAAVEHPPSMGGGASKVGVCGMCGISPWEGGLEPTGSAKRLVVVRASLHGWVLFQPE